MRKIRVDAIALDVDRDEQSREHVILRASSNREIADVVIPVLDVPEVAAGLLSLAQKSARKLTGVDLDGKIAESYKKKLVRFFPEPDSIFITADSSTLVLEMGCGSLNFKLTPELLAALKGLEFPGAENKPKTQPPTAASAAAAVKPAKPVAEAAPGRPKEARSAAAVLPRRPRRGFGRH